MGGVTISQSEWADMNKPRYKPGDLAPCEGCGGQHACRESRVDGYGSFLVVDCDLDKMAWIVCEQRDNSDEDPKP